MIKWMRAGTARVGHRVSAVSRRSGRMRLSVAVVLAVAVGAALAVVAEVVLIAVFHPARTGGSPIDVTKLAFTVVGGVGGVVALVIAYRRQRDLEQNRFVERFGAAAAQLGATDVAVRIAGVYAMAGVADESDGLRRQQCIDVLCGYLRLPYDAAHGSSGRTKCVVTVPNPRVEDLDDPGKVEEHHEYRNNDREVRTTIVRVIANHLRAEAEYSWSANDFDFRTVYLEDVDFNGATFSGTTVFDRATFSGTTSFDRAIFSGTASFDRATFSDTRFDRASFSDTASFIGTTFSGTASFDRATFSEATLFLTATFSDTANFTGATFSNITTFEHTAFSGTTLFLAATFSGIITFTDTIFSDTADFTGATFSRATWFDDTVFSGTSLFVSATFSGTCIFEKVDFGVQRISFADPKQWGPPEPIFDWSFDIALKPGNVEPQDWPPIVVAALPDSQ
ncbi:pentapeptide repeat-containing protein [Nocardia sp. NPDC052254]|uniref:pentapeptide repeat-containing protein n=1 Tax=Nocardia sp. NPDC052254 TaxID=3155681 RepID=UPI0034363C88